jgi:hypothetical protein
MISTKDEILSECYPHNLTWKEFMKDCEKAVNTSEVHSDEWSSEDEELARAECGKNKRSRLTTNNDSVIKVYEKAWRSSRVCKVVKLLK